jgi:hypothetical protein
MHRIQDSRELHSHCHLGFRNLKDGKDEKWKQLEHTGNKRAVLLPIVALVSFFNPRGLGKKPEG